VSSNKKISKLDKRSIYMETQPNDVVTTWIVIGMTVFFTITGIVVVIADKFPSGL
jgi:hypothetical protein